MDVLGSGKNGKIFLRDIGGKEFALKQFKNTSIGFQEILEAIFLSGNECEYLTSASSINFDDEEEVLSIYMEVATSDCSIFRRTGRALNGKNLMNLTKEILRGVEYLHSLGIIHRDIKPSNILLFNGEDDNFISKINDFGMSVRSPIVSGEAYTSFYCPPEVWGGGEYSSSADIWALGCTLFELYHGEILFPIKTPNIKDSIYSKGLKKLNSSNDDFDLFLSELIRIEPEERLTIEEILTMEIIGLEPNYIETDEDFDISGKLENILQGSEDSSRIIADKIGGIRPLKENLEKVTRWQLYLDEKKVISSFRD